MKKYEWCEQNGIKRSSFFRWQREVRKYLLQKEPEISIRQNTAQVEISESNTNCTAMVVEQKEETEACFVELPVLQPQKDFINPSELTVATQPSMKLSYGEFSLDLKGQVNEQMLASVLKVITHKPYCSKTLNTGIQYFPVDSIQTSLQLYLASQLHSSFNPFVKEEKRACLYSVRLLESVIPIHA